MELDKIMLSEITYLHEVPVYNRQVHRDRKNGVYWDWEEGVKGESHMSYCLMGTEFF